MVFCIYFYHYRTNSVRELEAFAENAIAVNRLILRHMSISQATGPMFRCVSEENLSPSPRFLVGSEDTDDSNMSCDSDTDGPPVMWMALSPPGESSLAKRRSKKITTHTSDSKLARSPPKVLSSMF